MAKSDVNEIVAIGLTVMGVLAVIGWAVYAVIYGQPTGTEIPISISSGLAGVLTGKALSKGEKHSES